MCWKKALIDKSASETERPMDVSHQYIATHCFDERVNRHPFWVVDIMIFYLIEVEEQE